MGKAPTNAKTRLKSKTTHKSKPKTAAKARAAGKAKLPLYLTEEDVRSLVTVEDAIAVLEGLFASWRDPATVNLPRQRARTDAGMFNLMGAAWGAKQLFGLKAYYGGSNAAGGRYHALLYSATDGKLKAMIESDALGQMRTGAASGLATKLLANPDAGMVGVIGTGRQAFTQVAAVCAVRPVKSVHVFSRTPQHRDAFARKLEREVGVAAQATASAEAAVGGADVVITITKSGGTGTARELAQIRRPHQCRGRQLPDAARDRPRDRITRLGACDRSGRAGPARSCRISRPRGRRTAEMAGHHRAWRSRDRQGEWPQWAGRHYFVQIARDRAGRYCSDGPCHKFFGAGRITSQTDAIAVACGDLQWSSPARRCHGRDSNASASARRLLANPASSGRR